MTKDSVRRVKSPIELESIAWEALEQIKDPELPVSVVGLGLIRGLEVCGSVATVRLTFTSMGCPWTEWIESDIRRRLLEVDGITSVQVEVVWNRPWSAEDIRSDVMDELKSFGILGG